MKSVKSRRCTSVDDEAEWKRRPLESHILEYCCQDVSLLFNMLEHWKVSLESMIEVNCVSTQRAIRSIDYPELHSRGKRDFSFSDRHKGRFKACTLHSNISPSGSEVDVTNIISCCSECRVRRDKNSSSRRRRKKK